MPVVRPFTGAKLLKMLGWGIGMMAGGGVATGLGLWLFNDEWYGTDLELAGLGVLASGGAVTIGGSVLTIIGTINLVKLNVRGYEEEETTAVRTGVTLKVEF